MNFKTCMFEQAGSKSQLITCSFSSSAQEVQYSVQALQSSFLSDIHCSEVEKKFKPHTKRRAFAIFSCASGATKIPTQVCDATCRLATIEELQYGDLESRTHSNFSLLSCWSSYFHILHITAILKAWDF